MEMITKLSVNHERFKPIMRLNIENESLDDIRNTLSCISPELRKHIYVLIRRVFSTCSYTPSKLNSFTQNISLQDFYKTSKELGFKNFKNRNLFSSCEACGDLNTIHILHDLSIYKCVNDINFEGSKIGFLKGNGAVEYGYSKLYKWYEASDFTNDKTCCECSKSATCLGGCILHNLKTGRRNCSTIEHIISGYI